MYMDIEEFAKVVSAMNYHVKENKVHEPGAIRRKFPQLLYVIGECKVPWLVWCGL